LLGFFICLLPEASFGRIQIKNPALCAGLFICALYCTRYELFVGGCNKFCSIVQLFLIYCATKQ
jgi:hypothetical protein